MPSTSPRAVAIVTGASRGVGPHVATALASRYDVVLTARSADDLRAVADGIDSPGVVAPVVADVTLAVDRTRVVAEASKLGPVTALVNNAAVGPIFPFHDHSPDDVANVIDTNLTGPIELSRLVLPGMIDRGQGHIVNVATVAARLPMPHMALYSATKAGLAEFGTALRLEYEGRGVSVTTILPGAVAEVGMAVRAAEASGVDLPTDGAVPPQKVAEAVLDALDNRRDEVFVGTGARFMTRHPRLAYRLIRRSGAFAALEAAAARFAALEKDAA